MRWIGRVALVVLYLACATPRLPEPYGVAGARFKGPLGLCLPQALRSASIVRYKGELAPGTPSTLQAQHFWLYGHYNDAGPRIVDAIAAERHCRDGTYYLFVNVLLSGYAADADPDRILPMLDQVVVQVTTACKAEAIEIEGSHLERSPEGKCAG